MMCVITDQVLFIVGEARVVGLARSPVSTHKEGL
jgi:hypothetical protein